MVMDDLVPVEVHAATEPLGLGEARVFDHRFRFLCEVTAMDRDVEEIRSVKHAARRVPEHLHEGLRVLLRDVFEQGPAMVHEVPKKRVFAAIEIEPAASSLFK